MKIENEMEGEWSKVHPPSLRFGAMRSPTSEVQVFDVSGRQERVGTKDTIIPLIYSLVQIALQGGQQLLISLAGEFLYMCGSYQL